MAQRIKQPKAWKSALVATGTTEIKAPASEKRLRIMRLTMMISAQAATSGGAEITLNVKNESTETGIIASVWVPSTSVTTGVGAIPIPLPDLGPEGLLLGVNSKLNVTISATLSSGHVRVIIGYDEE